ncbi:MAG: hypothetical protein H0W72_10430 [Planctomycetes bacterium]|nr:hypothetical protein [Planctomycetota bacterium]
MNARSATALLVVALVAIVVAKLVFHVRVGFAGFKYLIVLLLILVLFGWIASALGRRDPPA